MSNTSERARLARDIHDRLGHVVAALNFDIDAVDRELGRPAFFRSIRDRFDELNAVLRDIVSDLHPVAMSISSLRRVVEAWAAGRSIATYVSLPDEDDHGFPPEIVGVLADVLREALTNIAKHASGATSVDVQLRSPIPGRWHLEVTDDGPGLPDLTAAKTGYRGFGFETMRERLAEFGGHLNIGPRQGRTGTKLIAEIEMGTGHASD